MSEHPGMTTPNPMRLGPVAPKPGGVGVTRYLGAPLDGYVGRVYAASPFENSTEADRQTAMIFLWRDEGEKNGGPRVTAYYWLDTAGLDDVPGRAHLSPRETGIPSGIQLNRWAHSGAGYSGRTFYPTREIALGVEISAAETAREYAHEKFRRADERLEHLTGLLASRDDA